MTNVRRNQSDELRANALKQMLSVRTQSQTKSLIIKKDKRVIVAECY